MKNILTFVLLTLSFSALASNVDLSKSSFDWKATKVTGGHIGTVKLKSGNLEMKKGRISGGELVADMNSVDVTDLEGDWKTKFLNHMKSEDFFNIPKYPTATLKVKKDDGKNLIADMTILGKTNEVKIPYTKKGDTYQGTLKFDRTKWGMNYRSGNFFKDLGDKLIHNEITLNFKVVVK